MLWFLLLIYVLKYIKRCFVIKQCSDCYLNIKIVTRVNENNEGGANEKATVDKNRRVMSNCTMWKLTSNPGLCLVSIYLLVDILTFAMSDGTFSENLSESNISMANDAEELNSQGSVDKRVKGTNLPTASNITKKVRL